MGSFETEPDGILFCAVTFMIIGAVQVGDVAVLWMYCGCAVDVLWLCCGCAVAVNGKRGTVVTQTVCCDCDCAVTVTVIVL